MNKEDTITWQDAEAVTKELLSRLCPLDQALLDSFDSQTGIYVVAYSGKDLGYRLWGNDGPRVVYAGKSKSNSSRHFISGQTGTSTLRRSLAALLQSQLDLVPVPRSLDSNDDDRYINYMLDQQGEEKLTVWMKENFSGALYQTEAEKADQLLNAVIAYNVPMFNFQNNPENKYGAEIKALRKKCGDEAIKNGKLLVNE